MLSCTDLASIHRSLAGECVLSLYVDHSADDPAEQHAWRTALEGHIGHLRQTVADASAEESEQFERCASRVADALATFGPKAG